MGRVNIETVYCKVQSDNLHADCITRDLIDVRLH